MSVQVASNSQRNMASDGNSPSLGQPRMALRLSKAHIQRLIFQAIFVITCVPCSRGKMMLFQSCTMAVGMIQNRIRTALWGYVRVIRRAIKVIILSQSCLYSCIILAQIYIAMHSIPKYSSWAVENTSCFLATSLGQERYVRNQVKKFKEQN